MSADDNAPDYSTSGAFSYRCLDRPEWLVPNQRQAAVAVGVTERNYQDWEYGNTKPGFDALIALADYFDVSLDCLVGRPDDPARH